jgi:hypothetical protein
MSYIIFEGNTYTFGATVSANPGTGTTSYVFGGLSSGWTYGFIIWAFNGFGNSNIVGPVTKVTLSEIPEEIRPMIGAASWAWPHSRLNNSITIGSGSELNLIPVSEDMSNRSYWSYPTQTSALGGSVKGATMTTGFTAPDGTNTAFKYEFGNTSDSGYRTITPLLNITPIYGGTYIASIYVTGTNYGATSWNTNFYTLVSGSALMPGYQQQILPTTGTKTTSTQLNINFSGYCGATWNRFAWVLYIDPSSPGFNSTLGYIDTRYWSFMRPTANAGQIGEMYLWGPQLEPVDVIIPCFTGESE